MNEPRVAPIGRGSLVEEVVMRLTAVISKLPPGTRLPTEQQLCEQLEVSRTSVRGAMQRLAERGLVSVEVGRGTFVRRPDTQELSERLGLLVQLDRHSYWKITEGRRIVETQIAGLAAARRGQHHIDAMRDALAQMDESMSDAAAFAVGDERFHLAVSSAADNEILAMFSQQLQAMIRAARREIFSLIEISPQAQELHWEIFRAIERRAPAEATAAVASHLDEMEVYVRRTLAAETAGEQMGGA